MGPLLLKGEICSVFLYYMYMVRDIGFGTHACSVHFSTHCVSKWHKTALVVLAGILIRFEKRRKRLKLARGLHSVAKIPYYIHHGVVIERSPDIMTLAAL